MGLLVLGMIVTGLILFLVLMLLSFHTIVKQWPEARKAEIKKLLHKHGLTGFSVVEVHWDDSLWFRRDGKLCKFQ